MRYKRSFSWFNFLPKNFIISIATAGGIGFKSRMPGTIGSFIGFVFFALFFRDSSLDKYLFIGIPLVYFAIGVCAAAENHLMQKDPSAIILDEIIAVPFIYIGLGNTNQNVLDVGAWKIYFIGIILFRFFDIIKPLGIKKIEGLNGGVGCVLDDIIAALMACLCLHLIIDWKLV